MKHPIRQPTPGPRVDPQRPGRLPACHAVLAGALAWALALPAAAAQPGAAGCGELDNGGNGPFDYRNERRDLLRLGEAHHFTPKVEALLGGQSRVEVGGDLDYILRQFPNHHRALLAMMRWGEKHKTLTPSDTPFSVECYFERALRFRPDDNVARMIYASFLNRSGRSPDALQQLDLVVVSAGENALTHHNAGLQYFELKQYDRALAQAHAAIRLGFPAKPLRDRLQALGKWSDPVEAVVPASGAASAPVRN